MVLHSPELYSSHMCLYQEYFILNLDCLILELRQGKFTYTVAHLDSDNSKSFYIDKIMIDGCVLLYYFNVLS